MNKRFAAGASLVAAGAAAAGLFAGPSKSAASNPYCKFVGPCVITLTGTGPSPSTLTMHAWRGLSFINTDSVTHTVVFANGLCYLTLTPGEQTNGGPGAYCKSDFTAYAGTYAYTVDGKFPGTVITRPLRRSVTLTAGAHTIRSGRRLTLHGEVTWQHGGLVFRPPFPVIVLARHNSRQPFKPIATLSARFHGGVTPDKNGFRLIVQPGVTTTYIAEATGQLPQARGEVWTPAKSRPFTVRVRH
jgi:plastocyanin